VQESEEQLWKDAKSLRECAELTARWLEGTIAYYPGYGGPADDETMPLVPILVRLNRAGILTTFSQPGWGDISSGSAQRASFDGYTSETIAKQIAAIALCRPVIVFAYPPECEGGYYIPVSTGEFHPSCWSGRPCRVEESGFEEGFSFSPSALADFRSAWELAVIDPKWGREDYLWSVLEEWLDGSDADFRKYSTVPLEGAGLDPEIDFIY
jgi:hypothetical protein